MQIRATDTSAAITGICSGVLGLVLGPHVDNGGPLWLLLSAVAIGGAAYLFVFGVSRADMVGPWMFRPDLLRRVALWMTGIIAVGTIAELIFLVR